MTEQDVKRLSITNVKKLEQFQPTTEHPSLDYTRSWLQVPKQLRPAFPIDHCSAVNLQGSSYTVWLLQAPAGSAPQDVTSDRRSDPQPSHSREGDSYSNVSRTSDGHTSGSALPRKVRERAADVLLEAKHFLSQRFRSTLDNAQQYTCWLLAV